MSYNIVYNMLYRYYQYIYIAIMYSYIICSVPYYDWFYNSDYKLLYNNILLCKVYIPMYLENRCMLLEPELLV